MKLESTTRAVKEWAVVIEAMRRGEQVFLLRKNGLKEPNDHSKEGAIGEPFLLYPTYKKQDPGMCRAEMVRKFSDQFEIENEPDIVRITTGAVVTDDIVIQNSLHAYRLWEHNVWRADYLKERIDIRPEQNLHLLFARTFQLNTPIELPASKDAQQSMTWVALDEPISLEESMPVLSAPNYKHQTRVVRELLNS